jgi:hypothetical protein
MTSSDILQTNCYLGIIVSILHVFRMQPSTESQKSYQNEVCLHSHDFCRTKADVLLFTEGPVCIPHTCANSSGDLPVSPSLQASSPNGSQCMKPRVIVVHARVRQSHPCPVVVTMSLRPRPLSPALLPFCTLIHPLDLPHGSGAQMWLQPLLAHPLLGILSILKTLQAILLLTKCRTTSVTSLGRTQI